MSNELRFDDFEDWLGYTLSHPNESPAKTEFELIQTQGPKVQGQWLAPAVLQLIPDQRTGQETWILSAGIHGNETAPIELLNQLLEDWRHGQWQLRVPLLLILGNPQAMVAGERFVHQNLNRLFGPTRPNDTATDPESVRAQVLRDALQRHVTRHPGRIVHYDLHTAIRDSAYERFAVCPLPYTSMTQDQIHFLAQSDIQASLLNPTQTGNTFSFMSAFLHEAEAATVELGKVHPFGKNDLSPLTPLYKAIVTRLQGETLEPSSKTFKEFEIINEVTRFTDDFEFFVEDSVPNFTAFAPGTLIARDNHYEYRTGAREERILFPNPKVHNGHRAALMIVETQA